MNNLLQGTTATASTTDGNAARLMWSKNTPEQ
jgi:hypothetical protein